MYFISFTFSEVIKQTALMITFSTLTLNDQIMIHDVHKIPHQKQNAFFIAMGRNLFLFYSRSLLKHHYEA